MNRPIIAALLIVLGMQSAQASLVRLDFAGTVVANFPDDGTVFDSQFSGFFLLDASTPDSNDTDPTSGSYANAPVGGIFTWDSTEFVHAPMAFNFAFVWDLPEGDFFGLITEIESATGERWLLQLGFSDSSGAVFSDDTFPSDFMLGQFDDFDLDNDFGTGVLLGSLAGPGQILQGSLSSARLQPVPVPATFWFLVSAVTGLGAMRVRPHRTRP